MSEDTFTLDELQNFSLFIPEPQEIEDLNNFDGNPSDLGLAEIYFMEIMKVPNFSVRINTLIYKLSFEENVNLYQEKCISFLSAIDTIRNDNRIHSFLEYILAIGNYVNGGTRRGGTHGFKLSSLKSMLDVKSVTNPSLTLLHYAVEFIQENQKDVLDIFYEFGDIHSISKDNLEDITSGITRLVSGLALIENALKNPECDDEFSNAISRWVPEAKKKCSELQSLSTRVQNDYKEMINYYAEAPIMKSDQFFQVLSEFSKLIEKCILDNVKIKEEEEKEKRREEEDKKPNLGSSKSGKVTGNPMLPPNQGQLDMILNQMKRGNAFRKRGSTKIDKPLFN